LPAVDLKKVRGRGRMHDGGEVINGDSPARLQVNTPDKWERERGDFIEVGKALPEDVAAGLLDVWDEYEGASTPEAKFVKAIDKIESILQHNQGNFAPDFDHAFDLSYGRQYMTVDPIIEELRKMVDTDTQKIIDESN